MACLNGCAEAVGLMVVTLQSWYHKQTPPLLVGMWLFTKGSSDIFPRCSGCQSHVAGANDALSVSLMLTHMFCNFKTL